MSNPTADYISFEEHLDAYNEEFVPSTYHERFLVQMMAHSRWKLDRLHLLEAKLFDDLLTGTTTEAQTKALASLQKYTAAAERTYYKALREFEAGRKADIKAGHEVLTNAINAVAFAPLPSLHSIPDLKTEPAAPKTVTAPRRL